MAIKSREVDDSEGTFTCPAQAGAKEGGCAEVALRDSESANDNSSSNKKTQLQIEIPAGMPQILAEQRKFKKQRDEAATSEKHATTWQIFYHARDCLTKTWAHFVRCTSTTPPVWWSLTSQLLDTQS